MEDTSNVYPMTPKTVKPAPHDAVADQVLTVYRRLLDEFNSTEGKADIQTKFALLEMSAVLVSGLGHTH